MKATVNSKVGAGAVAGAFSVILVWILNFFMSKDALPADVVAAITTVFAFAVSWLVPETLPEKHKPLAKEGLSAPQTTSTISTVPRLTETTLN